jgi:hypothetical protein
VQSTDFNSYSINPNYVNSPKGTIARSSGVWISQGVPVSPYGCDILDE